MVYLQDNWNSSDVKIYNQSGVVFSFAYSSCSSEGGRLVVLNNKRIFGLVKQRIGKPKCESQNLLKYLKHFILFCHQYFILTS